MRLCPTGGHDGARKRGKPVDVLRREWVYIWYYFTVQLEQIFRWWVLGMLIGSAVSVFAKDSIHRAFRALKGKRLGVLGIAAASALGIASPLCMYGTIPIAASFSRSGMRDSWLAAFMMSSILLNPQLIVYSAALGGTVLTVRIVSCFLCGIAAGLLLHFFYKDKPFFDFSGFDEPRSRDTDPNLLLRYLKNLWRNVKATGLYFLLGALLSALFQRYVPAEAMTALFGGNEALGVLMAATIGVPLYACGGGTIPLLQQWLWDGMSVGSAASFMLTGPSTKITNLGALKIVLGCKRFCLYIAYVMAFSLVTGLIVNLIL
ncbi:MAG TPA: permease [Candidatus Ornithocaccomicrobium faecavium]|uniref:Permease n=1 Tax=Candidatus Ornithocaccomicrobium faecavium TaxID=2840890 RepID=A0A9D1P9H0_9FIRM|nr:permease [Candidatus Ornithocaccomicrobium faecavium]